MNKFFSAFRKDEKGGSAAEYALILAIIGGLVAGGAVALGTSVDGALDTSSQVIDAGTQTLTDALADLNADPGT